MLDDLGDLDDLDGLYQSLVDLVDSDLSDMDLVDQLFDLSSDDDLLLLEDGDVLLVDLDDLSEQDDLLWKWLGDDDTDWWLGNHVALSNIDLDHLSDLNNLFLNDCDLFLQFDDLWLDFIGLFWVCDDNLLEFDDLDSDLGDLLNQGSNLQDVCNNNLSDLDELFLDRSWLDTDEVWSSERVELFLDESPWLEAFFSGIFLLDLGAGLLELSSLVDELLDAFLIFGGVLTSEGWLEEAISLVFDDTDNFLLLLDELSDNFDLLHKDTDLFLDLGDLCDDLSLLGFFSDSLDFLGELNQLNSENTNLLDNLLDEDSLGDDDLLDFSDLGLFFLSEYWDLDLLDVVDLDCNLSD